jgi:hypothetical protein
MLSLVPDDPTYLHPVGLAEALGVAGSKGPSWNTVDHHGQALLTGGIPPQLHIVAQLTAMQAGLVPRAVHPEAPVVLLPALGQQPETGNKEIELSLVEFS